MENLGRKLFFSVCVFIVFLNFTNAYSQHNTKVVLRDFTETALRATMQTNINAVLNAVNRAYDNGSSVLEFPKESLTDSARNTLLSLWGNSRFYCTKAGILAERVLHRYDGYQVRNIPVCFVRGEEGDKYQQLYFNFNRNGKITGVNIAPDMHQYTNIMNKVDADDVADATQKQIIENVIANFRTAYNTKDINYLEAIYSDDALIITGNVFRRVTTDGIVLQEADYKVQTKEEYIENLGKVFDNNKWINIKLTTLEITQHIDYPYLYGVNLYQEWKAEGGYSDEGYLFLLFDFRNEKEPTIWVRTWQAAVDNDGHEVKYKPGELYSLDDIDWVGQ